MDDLIAEARKASANPKECRDTIDRLRRMGFGAEFKQLHHLSDTADGFYRYSKGISRFRGDGNNHRLHQRLMFVLLSCLDGATPTEARFHALVEEANRAFPPVPIARRRAGG